MTSGQDLALREAPTSSSASFHISGGIPLWTNIQRFILKTVELILSADSLYCGF